MNDELLPPAEQPPDKPVFEEPQFIEDEPEPWQARRFKSQRPPESMIIKPEEPVVPPAPPPVATPSNEPQFVDDDEEAPQPWQARRTHVPIGADAPVEKPAEIPATDDLPPFMANKEPLEPWQSRRNHVPIGAEDQAMIIQPAEDEPPAELAEEGIEPPLEIADEDSDVPWLRQRQTHLPIGVDAQRLKQPPAPEIQSGFVNPALARVAAVRPRPPIRELSEVWLGVRTLVIVITAALISAFIFNYWTPDSFLSDEFVGGLQAVSSTQGPPTAVPSPLPTFESVKKIGLITGHSGPPLNPQFDVDPGAVCDDNGDGIPELTELSVNASVTQRMANILIAAGYQVDLLEEFDPRLDGYRADVLISIHANTCADLGFGATGFNVEGNTNNAVTLDRDARLAECIAGTYGTATGMPRHFGRTHDLVFYHVFRKISVDTPTAIVELGFLFANRDVLVNQPDAMAQGIVDGIECFLNPTPFVPTEIPPGQ